MVVELLVDGVSACHCYQLYCKKKIKGWGSSAQIIGTNRRNTRYSDDLLPNINFIFRLFILSFAHKSHKTKTAHEYNDDSYSAKIIK